MSFWLVKIKWFYLIFKLFLFPEVWLFLTKIFMENGFLVKGLLGLGKATKFQAYPLVWEWCPKLDFESISLWTLFTELDFIFLIHTIILLAVRLPCVFAFQKKQNCSN